MSDSIPKQHAKSKNWLDNPDGRGGFKVPHELITNHAVMSKKWTTRFPPRTLTPYKFAEHKIKRLPLDRWRQFCAIEFGEFEPGIQQIAGLIGCKYPLGERPNLTFCNKKRVPGLTYCQTHYNLCHVRK